MQSKLIAGVAAALIATFGSAFAADMSSPIPVGMAVKSAPPPPPPPAWTGCYLGVNIGLGLSQVKAHEYYDSLGSHLASNVIGGGQVGCNYQFDSFLIGVQGMFDGAPIDGSNHTQFTDQDNVSRLNWFATATGRVGFLANPGLLLYVKGGAAWLNAKYSQVDIFFAETIASRTVTRQGWVVGGGTEIALSRAFSLFLEYNYMDFGRFNVNLRDGGWTYPISVRQQVHTFMVGANYRFGP